MSYDFFRKERPDVFRLRFLPPAPPMNAWRLNSHTIFTAKNLEGKVFTINVDGRQSKLEATVLGTELVVRRAAGSNLRISEANLADALASRNASSELYQIARKLCKDHAASSTSSPLISGCITDNFAASTTYPGCKLHLKLRFRQPFMNPFVSGLEREYFLIGQVSDTDCASIEYLGRADENLRELVNPFGSAIPRPRRSPTSNESK